MTNDITEAQGAAAKGELKDTIEHLEGLPMHELRKLASTVYRVPTQRHWTKNEIIEAITNKQRNSNMLGVAVGDGPAAGRARIVILKDPSQDAANLPVYLAVNGHDFLVPRGVEVDVPVELVTGCLATAKVTMPKLNAKGDMSERSQYVNETTHSYPYQVLASNPLPEGKGILQQRASKRFRLREMFCKKYGFWPSSAELREFRKTDLGETLTPERN